MVIKGLVDFDSSLYLCVLKCFTKTGTRFKSYQDTRNQRALNSETNSEDQKVSSERSDGSSEAMFRSFRRAFRSEPRIIFRSCVQKLQKDVQKRTHKSSSEAVFRSFRRAFRSKLRIIFRSCVQKLQKGVQKRTQNHQEREEHARHM